MPQTKRYKKPTNVLQFPRPIEESGGNKNAVLKKRVAAGAIGLIALAGIIWAAKATDTREHQRDQETAILNDTTPRLLNGTAVLHEGVTIRKTPHILNNSEADNIDSRLTDGNSVTIDKPVVYDDAKGDQWFGWSTGQDDDYVWVNRSELDKQGNMAGKEYFTLELPDPTTVFVEGHLEDGVILDPSGQRAGQSIAIAGGVQQTNPNP